MVYFTKHRGAYVEGECKHWTQELKYNYTGCQCQCYVPINSPWAMSCTWSLCTPKALLIADNLTLFSDFFDPQSSLLSILQSRACNTQSERVSRLFVFDLWPLDLTLVVLHARTILGFAKWRLDRLAQPGENSVYCVYNNADSVTRNDTAVRLSLEHRHKLHFCHKSWS